MADHSHSADHGTLEFADANSFDMESHTSTYASVIKMFKWGSVVIAVVVAFLMIKYATA